MPLISVVVTVYNLEDYIADCLESLVTQTFDNFEVVVVDNGSSDQSVDICQGYADKYPNLIKLITLEPPSEMHRGHKAGINAARGSYIHIIDGDDLVREGYLQEVAAIIKKEDVDVVIGHFSGFTEGSALPYRDVLLANDRINNRSSDDVIAYIGKIPAFHLAFWRYIFKKKPTYSKDLFQVVIPENGRFPLLDALVTFRILFGANSYYLVETPFYYYRQRGDSVSAPNNKQTIWHIQSFTEFLMLLHEGKYEESRREFIISKLHQSLRLAVGQSDLWNQEALVTVSLLLNKARLGFGALADDALLPNDLLRFRDIMKELTHIGPQEIAHYFKTEREALLRKLEKSQSQLVAIFPCGQFARQVQRWMTQAGYRDIVFVDNNPDMDNRMIQGSRCHTLAYVNSLMKKDKIQITVLISTIYEKLDLLLHNQCRDAGIPEDSIIII